MLARPKPTPPPEPPQPALEMPKSEAEVDAALIGIEHERAAIQAMLAGLPARETELLDQDADDAAFVKLDIDKKRYERALERLDRKEAQLVQVAEKLHGEAQQVVYGEIRQRYVATSQDLAEATARVEYLLETVNSISGEADRAGFSVMQQPTLPPVGYSPVAGTMAFGGHLNVLANQAAIAARTPVQVPRLAPRERTYAIRFLKWTEYRGSAFQRGQIAGFKGSVCRRFVEAGRAEWMKPGMTFDPWAAAFGAGPAPAETPRPHPAPTDQDD
jgi:hypothetical protein